MPVELEFEGCAVDVVYCRVLEQIAHPVHVRAKDILNKKTVTTLRVFVSSDVLGEVPEQSVVTFRNFC